MVDVHDAGDALGNDLHGREQALVRSLDGRRLLGGHRRQGDGDDGGRKEKARDHRRGGLAKTTSASPTLSDSAATVPAANSTAYRAGAPGTIEGQSPSTGHGLRSASIQTTRCPASNQTMSSATLQFFIQNEWRSLVSKTKSIPSRRPTDSRPMYPRPRAASSAATSSANS